VPRPSRGPLVQGRSDLGDRRAPALPQAPLDGPRSPLPGDTVGHRQAPLHQADVRRLLSSVEALAASMIDQEGCRRTRELEGHRRDSASHGRRHDSPARAPASFNRFATRDMGIASAEPSSRSIARTTPTSLPRVSTKGPPEFPGRISTDASINSCSPDPWRPTTRPRPVVNGPPSGKPMTTSKSPGTIW